MKSKFIDFVFDLFSHLRKNNVKLIYEGEISHNIIKAFTVLTENDLNARKEANPTKKKIFNIMVETLQNISKHAASFDEEGTQNGRGILLVSDTPEKYNVTTGNEINKDLVKTIKSSIDEINDLNKEELRELFKQKLSSGRLSDKGGAGLGFIDMRRKSNNKLEYNFVDINKDKVFYILNIVIDKY